MTWPQLHDLMDYWKAHPPLHLLVQAFMGHEGAGAAVEEASVPTEQDLQALVGMFKLR